jgi:hypothetical protein
METTNKSIILNKIQSLYVLPIARSFYLFIALVSLITVILGCIFSVYLQASISRPAPKTYIPTYNESGDLLSFIKTNVVENHINQPKNIIFISSKQQVNEQITEYKLLGYFQADTFNKIAQFPEGFKIVGGRDEKLFKEAFDSENKTTALQATSILADDLNKMLAEGKYTKDRTYEIKVIAKDVFGLTSLPMDVSVKLNFESPKPNAVEEPPDQELTDLQKIARDIARTIEPNVNAQYFIIYKNANLVPSRCGATSDNHEFIINYRKAFEQVKKQLNSSNIEAFYFGLCQAWKDAQSQKQVEHDRVLAERNKAIASNEYILDKYNDDISREKATLAIAITIVGGALATFLSISIVLAFLAIEGHSCAVRQAIEAIAKTANSRGNSEE